MPQQIQRLFTIFAIAGFATAGCLLTPATSYGFQKFKLGNGALLRKVFGKEEAESKDSKDSEKAKPEKAEPKKSLWPGMDEASRSAARSTFDQTRQKLEDDARRLQEDLRNKFKSPFQNNPQTQNPTAPTGSGYRNSPAERGRSIERPADGPSLSAAERMRADYGGLKSVLDRPQTPMNQNDLAPHVVSGRTPRNAGPQNQPRVPNLERQDFARQDFARQDFERQSAQRQNVRYSTPRTDESDLPAVGENPAGRGFGILGRATAGGGIQVTDVRPGSMAESIGVRRGDVLKSVAGLELSAVEEIDAITKVLQKDDQFEVFFDRNGKTISRMLSGSPQVEEATITKLSDNRAALPMPTRQSQIGNAELQRLQQQLKQQQEMIQQLKTQLQQQNSTPSAPSANTAPPALESDFGMELNLEPPR